MNVPSKDIQEMLEAKALEDSAFAAKIAKFTVTRATLDETKPNCIRLLDFSGWKPQLTMDRALYERPSVQIVVQCVDYDEGWLLLSSIIDILHGRGHEVWNNAYYSLIECLNGPAFLERENQRTLFGANFLIQRRNV